MTTTTNTTGEDRSRRELRAEITAFAGWCIALAAGMPLVLGIAPGWPAARVHALMAVMAAGVVLVLSGELPRRVRLPRG